MNKPDPCFLDAYATTQIEPEVAFEMMEVWKADAGLSVSGHTYGRRALKLLRQARESVAAVVDRRAESIVFTSGATEANNLIVLGMAEYGKTTGKRHIVTTQLEHASMHRPLKHLHDHGFEITVIRAEASGRVVAEEVLKAVRKDTLAVCVSAVNHETGIKQPIVELAEFLPPHPYFVVDAAQAFGKWRGPLTHPRIDFMSISAHKVHGPQGIGCVVLPVATERAAALRPVLYGNGAESGRRPGTTPVALAVGFGKAAELAVRDHRLRLVQWSRFRRKLMAALDSRAVVHGDQVHSLGNALSFRLPDVAASDMASTLSEYVAFHYKSEAQASSTTLLAMGLSPREASQTVRFSWSHLSAEPDWEGIKTALRSVNSGSVYALWTSVGLR